MMPSTRLNNPQPSMRPPSRILVDQGTSDRCPARHKSASPVAVISQVKVWNRPSQNMLISMFTTMVSAGSPVFG